MKSNPKAGTVSSRSPKKMVPGPEIRQQKPSPGWNKRLGQRHLPGYKGFVPNIQYEGVGASFSANTHKLISTLPENRLGAPDDVPKPTTYQSVAAFDYGQSSKAQSGLAAAGSKVERSSGLPFGPSYIQKDPYGHEEKSMKFFGGTNPNVGRMEELSNTAAGSSSPRKVWAVSMPPRGGQGRPKDTKMKKVQAYSQASELYLPRQVKVKGGPACFNRAGAGFNGIDRAEYHVTDHKPRTPNGHIQRWPYPQLPSTVADRHAFHSQNVDDAAFSEGYADIRNLAHDPAAPLHGTGPARQEWNRQMTSDSSNFFSDAQ